jgi:soluble lytic murein transglycosylase
MACDHGQSDRGKIAEAEALAGWIALTQLKDANAALAHFRRLSGVVRYPVSVARGAYWSARAAEALGRKAIARAWYADAARHPTTYYGHLAVLALGEDTAPQLPAQASATAAQSADFQKRDLVHAVHLMTELNEREHVATFIRALASSETTPANFSLVVSLAEAVDRTDLAVAIAKRAAQIGVPLISANFPVVQVTGHQRLERALQLAVIRQESQFDARAVSHAGARGLMQLMPATARKVASRNRLRYSRRRLTSSPDYNATLGSAYLASLIKDYKGSYVLAIAAYNAGTPRVRRWIRNFGDPRKKEVDVIDWVESIPFTETRNYVQRVMEGLQVYRQRLAGNGGRMRLALLEDLNR